jgi:hypothetical protein
MALVHVIPSRVQAMNALYGDDVFDISEYRQIECKSVDHALTELDMYKSSSKVVTTYVQKESPASILSILSSVDLNKTSKTYAVFSITRYGDVVKNFSLSGDLKNVLEVLVTTYNTVIYSTKDIIGDHFFTTWFPSFLAPYTPVKVYVQLANPIHNLSLTSVHGFLPQGTKTKLLGPHELLQFLPQTPPSSYSSSMDTVVAFGNTIFSLFGMDDIKITKTKDIESIPKKHQDRGISVKPYNCILFKGSNIVNGPCTRPDFLLASTYINNARDLGTITIQGQRADLSQFGKAHRNIRVNCDVPCNVQLTLNDVVYHSQDIKVGPTLIHDVPIIHAPYTVCHITVLPRDIKNDAKVTIQWDALMLDSDPELFKGKIVTPEFSLVYENSMLGVRRSS